MSTHERPTTQERPPTPTEGGCRCCNSTSAAAIAIAQASAYAAASASVFIRIGIVISIIIAILVLVIAIAFAFAFASAVAIAIAIAIAVAVAIAVAFAIASALAVIQAFPRAVDACSVILDVPPTASLADPFKPAVIWETIDPLGRARRVNIVRSADGGLTFEPVIITGGTSATDLPLTGSFIWEAITQFGVGTLLLVRAIAVDAAGNEVCRSQIRPIRIIP